MTTAELHGFVTVLALRMWGRAGRHKIQGPYNLLRPCGETRWPHASSPRFITGRSSKNRLPFWSWLAATARTPAPFINPADRRRYTLQHSCWMVQGSSSWPLWVDATDLYCLRDLMMMMMMTPVTPRIYATGNPIVAWSTRVLVVVAMLILQVCKSLGVAPRWDDIEWPWKAGHEVHFFRESP